MEQDKEIRKNGNREIEPLDLDKKRKLDQLILASVPFVRGFPTAQKFDDETRAFQQEQASIDSAKAVIKIASSIELLRKDNAEFLIDFANKSNVHADKAATSTVQSS